MAFVEPSDIELERHTRAVEKLRAQLFRTLKSTDYHALGECRVVGPMVSETHYPDRVDRQIALGGLTFDFDRGDEQYDFTVTVKHNRKDEFYLFVSQRHHTIKAMTVRFRVIDSTLIAVIAECRRNKVQPRLIPIDRSHRT